MLLQAQASVPENLSMCLNSFLTQDLSGFFRVVKVVEQAALENPISLGPFLKQFVSETVVLEDSDNLLGSATGDWHPNLS